MASLKDRGCKCKKDLILQIKSFSSGLLNLVLLNKVAFYVNDFLKFLYVGV